MENFTNTVYQAILYIFLLSSIIGAVWVGMKLYFIYCEYRDMGRLHTRELVSEFWYAAAFFAASLLMLNLVWGMGSAVEPVSNLYDWQLTDPRGVTR